MLYQLSYSRNMRGGDRIRTYSAEALDLQSSPPLPLWRTPAIDLV